MFFLNKKIAVYSVYYDGVYNMSCMPNFNTEGQRFEQ